MLLITNLINFSIKITNLYSADIQDKNDLTFIKSFLLDLNNIRNITKDKLDNVSKLLNKISINDLKNITTSEQITIIMNIIKILTHNNYNKIPNNKKKKSNIQDINITSKTN